MSRRNDRSVSFESGGIAIWLIRHAASQLPDCFTSRLEEEWLADIGSRSSALSRLSFAMGCCWAAMVITIDHPEAQAIPTPAGEAADLVTAADRNFAYLSLPSGTLFLIVGLYAALFSGLSTTLSHTRGLATSLNPPIPPIAETLHLSKKELP